MSLMAANEESDPSAILNDFWVTLVVFMLIPVSVSAAVRRGRCGGLSGS